MLKKTNKKRTNIYIHTHTSMHVGMYACMRSESESDLDNQLSGILRKANKKQDIHTHTHVCMFCVYDCLRSESESVSHSSPPQLNGVRVISACARACVLTAGVHAHKSARTKNR